MRCVRGIVSFCDPLQCAGPLNLSVGRPAQRTVQEWKFRISIRSILTESPLPVAKQQSLTPHLCYSCHTTLTSKSPRSVVPASKSGASTPTVAPSPSTAVPLPVWLAPNLRASSGSNLPDGSQLGSDVTESIRAPEEEVWVQKKMDEDKLKGVIGELLLEDSRH